MKCKQQLLFSKTALCQGEKKLSVFLYGAGWFQHHIAALWGINQPRISQACAEFTGWVPSASDSAEVYEALISAPESRFKSEALKALIDHWPDVIRTDLV